MNISYAKNPSLYTSALSCYEYLSNIDYSLYEYPSTVQLFHVLSDIKNAIQALTIESFIKTQNLTVCRLCVWSIADQTSNPFAQPYLDHPNIEFRVYNPRREYEGTPLEPSGGRWWPFDPKRRLLIPFDEDPRMWMNSGIFRFLIPSKYGGNYVDADVIFLTDFKPLLNTNFAYCWETSVDFSKTGKFFRTRFGKSLTMFGPCAAILGFKDDGAFAKACLGQLLKIPPRVGTTCYDEELMSAVYRRNPGLFTVFPAGFFEMEWQLKTDMPEAVVAESLVRRQFYEPVEDTMFFDKQFAWHYHNSGQQFGEIHPKSVLGRLMTRFHQ